MKTKIGVYAGSFNPFHKGHLNILLQAQAVFDKVIVAVGNNPEKSQNEREPLPTLSFLKNVSIAHYSGLLADYLSQLDLYDSDVEVFLIRGLRNGEDLQYEQNQIQFIRDMYPSLRVVFFICDKHFEHISSSSLRALKKLSIKDYERYAVLDGYKWWGN